MLRGSRAFQAKFIGHFSPTLVRPLAARISRRWLVVPPLAARISRRRLVLKVGTSKGSTISLLLQYIRGISYRGPTERKTERKKSESLVCRSNRVFWSSTSLNIRILIKLPTVILKASLNNVSVVQTLVAVVHYYYHRSSDHYHYQWERVGDSSQHLSKTFFFSNF
jgi:hypothetical protein